MSPAVGTTACRCSSTAPRASWTRSTKRRLPGKDVQLVADVAGWPELGTYAPAQNDAIQKGFDGLGCSFGAATWYQALSNAGMTDTVKIAAIDAFSDLTKTAWASGQMVTQVIEITSMFGMVRPAAAEHSRRQRRRGQRQRSGAAGDRQPMDRHVGRRVQRSVGHRDRRHLVLERRGRPLDREVAES